MRIVIADESLSFAQTLGSEFATFGYSAHAAESGAQVRALTRTISVDAVLVYLHLPDGDALELLNEFHGSGRKFVVYGDAQDQNSRLLLQVAEILGAHATFIRPFKAHDVLPFLRGEVAGDLVPGAWRVDSE